jgi:hypothetical protein
LVEILPRQLQRLKDVHQPHLGSSVLEMDCELQVKESVIYFCRARALLYRCFEHQVMRQHPVTLDENLEYACACGRGNKISGRSKRVKSSSRM